MKITVDLRSLHTQQYSGVEYYAVNLLERLVKIDEVNTYNLFFNAWKKKRFNTLNFVNTSYKQTRWPNKLLNISMAGLNFPKLEKLAGDSDALFMPNWNLVRLKRNTKLILTIHDLSPVIFPEFYGLKSRLWHKFIGIKKLIKRADLVLAVSDYTRQSVIDFTGIDESKVVTTKLGIDSNVYNSQLSKDELRRVRNQYGLPGEYIGFVGTVEPRKNLLGLIRAFDKLENASCHLVIAGKLGWKYGEVLRAAKFSKKCRLIKFIGYIPESDKPYFLKLATVFAWPSFYEGFGLPVLEAMAVGTPVVTSNVTSLPGLVDDTGIIVDPYNEADLASALQEVLSDRALSEMLSSKATIRASKFSWQSCAKDTLEAISKLQS